MEEDPDHEKCDPKGEILSEGWPGMPRGEEDGGKLERAENNKSSRPFIDQGYYFQKKSNYNQGESSLKTIND